MLQWLILALTCRGSHGEEQHGLESVRVMHDKGQGRQQLAAADEACTGNSSDVSQPPCSGIDQPAQHEPTLAWSVAE